MSLLSDDDQRTLVQMIEVMLPHDSFPVGPYERAAEAALATAADDAHLEAQLVQGVHDLDVLRGIPFVELPVDVALTVLRGIQDAPVFRSILGIIVVAFYDDHEVWELLGYEGPSFDQGDYIDRGFADLDWLPEPRIEEAKP